MIHTMKLLHPPFQAIKSGTKTIEMRLNDEKRCKIQPGDDIVFTDTDTGETLTVSVIALHRYSSFEELYLHHDKISIGYARNETADPKDMLLYYSKDKIKRYGVVGIEIRIPKR